MEFRKRSSSLGITSPCRLGSTSSAIKTETLNTSWLNDFTVKDTIGRGKFAVVKKCIEKSTGQLFAAKCIRKRRHNRECTPDILHEIAVLEMGSNHQHLIGLHKVYETNSEFVLILEYAAGGEIFDHCVGVKDSFTEAMSRRLMAQILDAVNFLHDNDIVHLDLKPQNILLSKDGTDPQADIKLVDFGLSKFLVDGLELREILGTPDYVAPEVLNYEPLSTATDVWSLGIVGYVMLTGVSPFLGESKQETLMNVTTASLEFPSDLFDDLSSACRDFIVNMLQREPSDRFSTKQSIKHPWITGHVLPSKMLSIEVEGRGSHDEVFLNGYRTAENGESLPSTVDDASSTASSCSTSKHSSCSSTSQDGSVPKAGQSDTDTLPNSKDDLENDVDYNGNILDATDNSAEGQLAQSVLEAPTDLQISTASGCVESVINSSESSLCDSRATQTNAEDSAVSCSSTNSPQTLHCVTKVKTIESDLRSPTPSPKMTNLTLSSSAPTSPTQTNTTLPHEPHSTKSDCLSTKGCPKDGKLDHSPVPPFFPLKTGSALLTGPSETGGNTVDPDPEGKSPPNIPEASSIVLTTNPCLKRRKFDYCSSAEQSATEISVAD